MVLPFAIISEVTSMQKLATVQCLIAVHRNKLLYMPGETIEDMPLERAEQLAKADAVKILSVTESVPEDDDENSRDDNDENQDGNDDGSNDEGEETDETGNTDDNTGEGDDIGDEGEETDDSEDTDVAPAVTGKAAAPKAKVSAGKRTGRR